MGHGVRRHTSPPHDTHLSTHQAYSVCGPSACSILLGIGRGRRPQQRLAGCSGTTIAHTPLGQLLGQAELGALFALEPALALDNEQLAQVVDAPARDVEGQRAGEGVGEGRGSS